MSRKIYQNIFILLRKHAHKLNLSLLTSHVSMRPQFLDFRSDMIKPSFLLFLSLSLSTILFLAHVLFNHSISLKRLFTNNLIHVNIIFNSRYQLSEKSFVSYLFALGLLIEAFSQTLEWSLSQNLNLLSFLFFFFFYSSNH